MEPSPLLRKHLVQASQWPFSLALPSVPLLEITDVPLCHPQSRYPVRKALTSRSAWSSYHPFLDEKSGCGREQPQGRREQGAGRAGSPKETVIQTRRGFLGSAARGPLLTVCSCLCALRGARCPPALTPPATGTRCLWSCLVSTFPSIMQNSKGQITSPP